MSDYSEEDLRLIKLVKEEMIKEFEKIVKQKFKEGDEYMEYAEDILFENGPIKQMLYTPLGIYRGTGKEILKELKKIKKENNAIKI